jgi:hypothetical protein
LFKVKAYISFQLFVHKLQVEDEKYVLQPMDYPRPPINAMQKIQAICTCKIFDRN